MNANQFRCDYCKQVFDNGWSDEEAAAECLDIFGSPPEGKALVCDECFKKIMSFHGHEIPEKWK